MVIKIIPNETDNPTGKLADAELYFNDGPLAGLKLQGFAVWERRGGSRNVVFPSRTYTINAEKRSYTLLRPIVDMADHDCLRDVILAAFVEFEAQAPHKDNG